MAPIQQQLPEIPSRRRVWIQKPGSQPTSVFVGSNDLVGKCFTRKMYFARLDGGVKHGVNTNSQMAL